MLLGQQSRISHCRNNLDHLGDVVAHAIHNPQIAGRREVAQLRRLALPALQHDRMRPCPAPMQPAPRLATPADDRQAKQVVQPAAVDADHGHLGSRQKRVKRQARLALRFPILCAGPIIRPQP